MQYYRVDGYEVTYNTCIVEAESKQEAIEKAFRGEFIEETQDTEPGKNIWPKKWKAEEQERIPWDGKGFAKSDRFVPKA